MVKLENISCKTGNFVLSNITLSADNGEYFTILGPTGSGKTILLECVAGIRNISKGNILYKNKNIVNLPPEKRKFGYVPQDYVLFPFLNVRENILFGLSDENGNRRQDLNWLAGIFRIENLLERMPDDLSGGEKQRVAIVRALIRKPDVLLMDEPYSSIDESLRKKLWLEMKTIHNDFGTTVIHITHDLEEAYTLSSKIAVLIKGKIEQESPRDEVFYNPRNRTVATFMGFRNIFTGRVETIDTEKKKMTIDLKNYRIITPSINGIKCGDNVEFCVLPQEIKILRRDREVRDSLKDNVFEGKIVNVVPHGISHTIYFKIKGKFESPEKYDFEINLPYFNFVRLNLSVGSIVNVAIRKNAIKVFPAVTN